MKNQIKTLTAFAILLAASLFLGKTLGYKVFAQISNNPPSFPSCNPKIFETSGDWASYDSGTHGIPGVGNFDGSDDVYSLSDGNFFQCFCPSEAGQGIQTNWWNVERAGLSSEAVASYVSQGWVSENGSGWNLYPEAYLAKNQYFSCTQITPTPKQEEHNGPPGAPVCNAPEVTKAPLYSSANLKRIDNDSIKISWIVTDGHAQRYGIHYGTSPDNLTWFTEVYGHETTEAVINAVPQGNIYFKVCSIGECGDSVCGSDIPTVLGVAKGLPSTGATVLILLGLAPIGYYITKRFKLL